MQKPLAYIVEDDLDLANLFAMALQTSEFETHTFENGRLAIEALNNTLPELIMLDLHLPDMTGEDVLNHLRTKPDFTGTRIIISSSQSAYAASLREKVDFLLDKPVDYYQLCVLSSRLNPNLTKT